jgi:hypothetical protein
LNNRILFKAGKKAEEYVNFQAGTGLLFHFFFDGRHYQQSIKQGSPDVTRSIEATVRSDLAKKSASKNVFPFLRF